MRDRISPLAITMAAVLVFVCVAPLLAPQEANAQNIEGRLEPPGRYHPLGTDGFGRDQLSRIIIGMRNSILVGLLSVAIGAALGVTFGAISAQSRGIVSWLLQRITDLTLGIPFFVLCIIIIISLEPSVASVGIALGAGFVPQIARQTRSLILPVSKQAFVEAARLNGTGAIRMVLRHLLPNVYAPLAAHLSTLFGVSVLAEAGLSYIGLGIPAPTPSLGRMLREGAGLYLEVAPWLTVFPGLAIVLIVLPVTVVADIRRGKYRIVSKSAM